ncbi:hypothetical protein D3C71_1843580 [compost metagenome]
MRTSDVFSDGISLVAMYSTFSLFHVNGVGGEIPMDNGVTPWVEIEPFLSNGRRRQIERPKRRVEGGLDGLLTRDGTHILGLCPKTQRKMTT